MLLDKVKVNASFPFVGRAASRSIVSSLNFTIASMVANAVRNNMFGVPAETGDTPDLKLSPGEHVPGPGIDGFNEAYAAAEEARHEAQMRHEQGYVVDVPPLELAGMLKVIRDHLAENLLENAGMRQNPLDPKRGLYPDPYHVGESLSVSFAKQMEMAPRVSEAQVRAQAEALNLDFEDCMRVTKQRQERGARFLKDNREEILQMLDNLGAIDAEGNPYGTADAEEVFEKLPAIHRARMYVSADRGLWYERDRAIGMMMRGHPDGPANIKLIDAARQEIHDEFDRFMKREDVRRDISDAVQRGATWPTLIDLPEKKKAAA